MYADRVDSAAKTSIKDRLNGNSVADSSRRREITGKRQRLDDKWKHDLYEDNRPRVSNRKIDAQDLRLKLQRRSFLQASPGSGVRDLREKLYGTMNSQLMNADRPKIVVAKPSRKSGVVEAPEPEIKKITSVASRKRSQQKLDSSVDVFLQSLGLEKYLITFQAEEVDMTALVHMTDEDLKALGIPMVYQQSIAACCIQDWPKERMLIQVLDDSDELDAQLLIKAEVQKWQQRGVHILYRHRLIRTGYKAGNPKSAMSCDYVKDYEFVAIFDADFQPGPDFLKRTIPHFKGKDDLALVQARWAFVNKDENLLTRLQNINLSFHFEVEQQVNGVFINFFGFNGTAGVWRIKALEDCGGWLERTTVEDMDIAVRAHLCGWKFIYLNDVKCLCELPESYEAYKKQQHRWHSGPMQLFRLCFVDILRAKVSFGKKANMIFLFFLLRKLILPFYSFTLFCIILPLTMFLPEAQLPAWVVCYVPGIMSILNILPGPRSFPFIVPYLLFENTMSVTKFNAMISGLFRLGSSYEWVVTKKLGRSSEADLVAFAEKESDPLVVETTSLHRSSSESGLDELNKIGTPKKTGKKKRNRLYRKELALALILLTASLRSLLSAQGIHFYFLLFQGISFLVVGLDLIGEQVS